MPEQEQEQEQLKSELRHLVAAGRECEAQLFRKMHEYHVKFKSGPSITYLMKLIGKNKRTIFNYLTLGKALCEGILTDKDIIDNGPTKLILMKDLWSGNPLWDASSLEKKVAQGYRNPGVATVVFKLRSAVRDTLYDALVLAGADDLGSNGLRGKEAALMRIIMQWSELQAKND